ncbi:hypothetical protein NLI96_g12562 [Meripilus lineatus]|uniref:Uncharacterized protein n=1 Tax=Meripilus lineatus TaxID=2056292 RepID=A0AAD5Y9S4_9APHY|nr:hypothetical protein NLI96_g12562 [Physisporinus lineatus]
MTSIPDENHGQCNELKPCNVCLPGWRMDLLGNRDLPKHDIGRLGLRRFGHVNAVLRHLACSPRLACSPHLAYSPHRASWLARSINCHRPRLIPCQQSPVHQGRRYSFIIPLTIVHQGSPSVFTSLYSPRQQSLVHPGYSGLDFPSSVKTSSSFYTPLPARSVPAITIATRPIAGVHCSSESPTLISPSVTSPVYLALFPSMSASIQPKWRTRARAAGDITYADGRLAAEIEGGKWVVTTPNADWIPEVLVGRISVSYHEDGRFGDADPTQWPQVYSPRFPHFCLMPRRPTASYDMRTVMWETLTIDDFRPALGCALTAFGVASATILTRLEPHIEEVLRRAQEYSNQHDSKGQRIRFTCAAMSDSYKRLSYLATFRDINQQFITVQRFWKESLAWLTGPAVDPTKASSIINMNNPTFTLYHGMIGDRALSVTCMGGHTYSDVEHIPHHDPDVSARPRIVVPQPAVPSSSLGFAPLREDIPILPPIAQTTGTVSSVSSLTRFSSSTQSQQHTKAGKASRSSKPYQQP